MRGLLGRTTIWQLELFRGGRFRWEVDEDGVERDGRWRRDENEDGSRPDPRLRGEGLSLGSR